MADSEARRIVHAKLEAIEIQRILGRPISATIAFVDPAGYPRMVPCWFLWAGGAFHTTSARNKYHVRCLERDPRGSFCVDFEETAERRRANRQVKGVGEFEITEGAGTVLAQMRSKYLGVERTGGTDVVADDRVVLRLVPDRLTAHGSDFLL